MQLPVILLPGIITPADITYRYLLPQFEGPATVIARDLAIYANGAPPSDYSLDTEVDAILNAVDEAGFERFHIGGFSGGGAISAAFAARHPHRLASLALMEPAWFGNEDQSEDEIAVREAVEATESLPYAGMLAAFAQLNVADDVEIPAPPAGDPPDWKTMVTTLAKGHEQVAKTAREVLRVAEEAGDDATADVVAPRVTLHEKTAWMLRATAS